MKFSIQLLLGFLLWNGVFFLTQGEAQIPLREQVKEELRKELREELKKELREEVKEKLRKEEIFRQRIKGVRQELREQVIIPCRNHFFKIFNRPGVFLPNRHEYEKKASKLFEELEDAWLKGLLENYSEDEDVRMGLYLTARRKCEKDFAR